MSQDDEVTQAEEPSVADLLGRVSDATTALEDAQETIVSAKNTLVAKTAEIEASNAAAPVPVWEGTSLRFKRGNSPEFISEPVDLKGDPGDVVIPEISLTVEVETLASDAPATGSFVLDAETQSYQLNLGIPQGEAGESPDNCVTTDGAQTLAGEKTFTVPPILPAPSDTTKTSMQGAPVSWVKDELRAEVEKASGGRNTVLRDADGNPNFFVVIPRFNLEDIASGIGSGPHPAFIAGGVVKSELLVAKFLASKSGANKVQSLPRKDPWASVNFDTALAACKAMGPGFSLFSNAGWAARALWLYKELGTSHVYHGNSNYGRAHDAHWQTGTMNTVAYQPGDTANGNARTLTGTGPEAWYDDGSAFGIADLVGNVWEWVSGLRLNGGEINIIPDNDAMLADCNMAANSPQWKALLSAGTLVVPGTASSLKCDGLAADTQPSWRNAGGFQINNTLAHPNDKGWFEKAFKEVGAASGVGVPGVLQALGLYPVGTDGIQGTMCACTQDERLAYRGGAWHDGGSVGPFCLSLAGVRTSSIGSLGFRPAFLAS